MAETVPSEYRFSSFPAQLFRDWEYYFILVVFLFLGIWFLFILASYNFLPKEEQLVPERYARLELGPAMPKGDVIQPDIPVRQTRLKGKPKPIGKPKVKGKPKAKPKPAARPREGKSGPPSQTQLMKESLVGVIASRSGQSNSALGKILQKGGIGTEVDQVLKGVKSGQGKSDRAAGSRISRGQENAEKVGVQGVGGIGTGYGGTGDQISWGVKSGHGVKAILSGGRAEIEGSLDAAIIDQVVRKNLAGLKYCYERELNRNPKLRGKVVVQFTIGLSGTVTEAFVESSTLGNASAEDCILRRIRRWRFPRPAGGSVLVAYPFVFTTGR